MFTKLKNVLISAVGGTEQTEFIGPQKQIWNLAYKYSRPGFLKFSEEEINAISDCRVRPLILPRDVEFPFQAGYCECINAGKSKRNEDQGAYWRRTITPKWWTKKMEEKQQQQQQQSRASSESGVEPGVEPVVDSGANLDDVPIKPAESSPIVADKDPSLTYTVFAIFDGHGGPMVAVIASREIEDILHEKLESVADLLVPSMYFTEAVLQKKGIAYHIELSKRVNTSQLIVGALESSFKEMDKRIGEDKENYKLKGGCTALLVLFILGKVYTAWAGDSRAIVVVDNVIEPLSRDHTPYSERMRICHIGHQTPSLLCDEFTPNEYCKKPTIFDLGENVLCRSPESYGYSYRRATKDDLKMPLISGTGKRTRLMNTIGVTRGFGDHELKALGSRISVKPFLSHMPEITILDLAGLRVKHTDVIIMGSDGLFDVTTNKEAVDIVRNFLDEASTPDDRKYLCAAQDLVNYARGKPAATGLWKKKNNAPASLDDITAWVIPLKPYQEEHQQWLLNYKSERCDDPELPDPSPCIEAGKLPIKTAEYWLTNDVEEAHPLDLI